MPYGRHGIKFTAEWTDDSVLPDDTEHRCNFRGDYFDIAVFGDCYGCIETGQRGTRQIDMSWVSISNGKEEEPENIKTCDLVCPCSAHLGSKPVGIESIFVQFHRDVALQMHIKAQCFGCHQKTGQIPPLSAYPLGHWRRLSFLGCCDNPKVKLVSLRFTASHRPSPPPSLSRTDEKQLVCCICYNPVTEQAIGCEQCAESYHSHCHKQWLKFRKKCSEEWCLSCHGKVKRAAWQDLHARNKKRKQQTSANLNQENISPNLVSLEMVKPKKRQRGSAGTSASAADTADVCFLMDCTGSMDQWIAAAKTSVETIAASSARLSQVSCRFAFVGYRDYDQDDRYSILNFTSDFRRFQLFLRNVQANGGYDECEDLLGGMDEAIKLDWQSDVRTLYLVCDAPCHGRQYNCQDAYDEYPNIPGHLAADVLFQKMHAVKVFPHGFRVGTDPKHGRHVLHMMHIFRAIWKQISGRTFPVQDLGSSTNLFSDSISGSLHNAVQRTRERQFVINTQGLRTEIHQDAGWIPGKLGTFQHPQTRNLLSRLLTEPTAELTFSPASLKIAGAPFNEDGNNKWVFHCQDAQRNGRFVAKVYNTEARVRNQAAYLLELDVSSKAQHYIDAFNRTRVSEIYLVHVLVEYFHADAPEPLNNLAHYLVEEFLEGQLQKFNSNSGWTYKDVLTGVAEVAQAFSHFTYKHSHKKEILVDVQGLVKNKQFHLHDIARHTKSQPSPLEPMNHGRKGIISFFKSHKCRATCYALGLQDCWPDMSASEEVLPVGRDSLRNSQALNPEPRRRSSQCHSIPEDVDEESDGDEDMSDSME